MKKISLQIGVWILVLISCVNTNAQFMDPATRALDSMEKRKVIGCGLNKNFILSHSIDTSAPPPGGGGGFGAIIVPPSFPAAAIDTCGKFRIFYEDLALGTGEGFADGLSGANRRDVVCAALTYIQNTLDFSGIPAGEYVRLQVTRSYTASFPAPTGNTSTSLGSPYFIAGAGVKNGFIYDYATTHADPLSGHYHARLQVNFDKIYSLGEATALDYYESAATAIDNCQYDLFSSVLHSLTHCLGWYSFVIGSAPPVGSGGLFSSLDTAAAITPWTVSATDPFGSIAKVVSGGSISHSGYGNWWLNSKHPPYNHPIHADDRNLLMHLRDSTTDYTTFLRVSPGDRQPYVMSKMNLKGNLRRAYTKGELEALTGIIGYDYNTGYASSHATAIANRIPYSSKMNSDEYNHQYFNLSLASHTFTEWLEPDFTITNDSGTTLVINLASDTTLHDADGDVISVAPGTLINFRGCGEGGNNHNSLSLSGGNTVITYTPRHNFYGRATFGFNLYDGTEKGAFVTYIIEVKKGTNVNVPVGENLVLNGDFEEGTEVKLKSSDETNYNTALDHENLHEGRFGAYQFADGNPFGIYGHATAFVGGGILIKNSYSHCSDAAVVKHTFGYKYHDIPYYDEGYVLGTSIPYKRVYPEPPSGGNRYSYAWVAPHYFYLGDTLKPCHRYRIEFDAYRYVWDSTVIEFPAKAMIGFTSTDVVDFDAFTVIHHPSYLNPTLHHNLLPHPTFEIDTFEWTHISIPFDYCGEKGADMLFFNPNHEDWVYGGLLFDNLSIVEDTIPVSVHIHDSLIAACGTHLLTADTSHVFFYRCDTSNVPLKYVWLAGADTVGHSRILLAEPDTLTLYTAIVSDGCHIAIDTLSIDGSAGPKVAGRDTAICAGESVNLALLYTLSGASGTVTYDWTPGTGLSCTTCDDPVAMPATTTTYWLQVTDTVDCFIAAITVHVNPLPDVSHYIEHPTVCLGGRDSARLFASGAYSYEWSGSGLSCTSCDTAIARPTVPGLNAYALIATDLNGCRAERNFDLHVFTSPVLSLSPSDTGICRGDTVLLSAGGAMSYTWEPPLWLSSPMTPTTLAYPETDRTYKVTGSGPGGCTTEATVVIHVFDLPLVEAAPDDTAICGPGSVDLSASGADTYSWTPTPGLSSPFDPAPTAYVASTTKYMVTGTDIRGCKSKDSVMVTVHSLPDIAVTTPVLHLCSADSVNLTATGGVSYTWSPSGGLSCTACNPTKAAAPLSPLVYTVTGTDTNGCKDSATVSISYGACACTPEDVFDSSAATLSGTVSGTFGAGYYYIPDDITITGTTTFTDAVVLIGEDVTVTVSNNALLTLDHSHWFTCPDSNLMWRGIVLASGVSTSGRIEVKNNSLIEDALWAIDALNLKAPPSGDIVKVTYSTFNRNQVDISLNGIYSVGSAAVYPVTIMGNVFTARKFNDTTVTGYPAVWPNANDLKAIFTPTDAKPAYVLHRDYPKAYRKDGEFSLIGVRYNNIGITFGGGTSFAEVHIGGGSSGTDFNLFDNHSYGFVAYNSNVSVYNNHFINISRRMEPSSSTTAPIENGMGIVVQSSLANRHRLQVAPSSGGNFTNRFHDCFMGIYTENIAYNNISNTIITTSNKAGDAVAGAAYTWETYSGYGMMLHCASNLVSNNVSSNRISNTNVGIHTYLSDPRSGAATLMNANLLYANNPDISTAFTGRQSMTNGIALYSTGAVGSTVNTAAISGNYMFKVFNGIKVSGLTTTKCSTTSNTITLWDTITPVTPVQYGIEFANTQEATVSDNAISSSKGTLTAARIRGVRAASNTMLRICANTTDKIGTGFEFAPGYVQTGTRWISNTMNDGYRGMVLASDIGDQGFTYNWVGFPLTFWGTTLNKWNIVGGGKYHTSAESGISSYNSKLYVRNITSGMVELPSLNNAVGASVRYLYTGSTGSLRIVQPQTNCMGAIYPTNDRWNPIPGTSVSLSKTIGLLVLSDSLGYDASYRLKQWMSQLALYEMGSLAPDLRDSSAALDSFMLLAQDSRFAWLTGIELALNNGELDTAEMLLNNPLTAMGRQVFNNGDIIVTDYTEADDIVNNYSQYYSAYIRYLRDSMSQGDTAAIEELAAKCPAMDGVVVYKARTLYERLSLRTVVYNDDSCEYNGGNQRRIRNEAAEGGAYSSAAMAYSLYPNPNSGSFTLLHSSGEDKLVSVRIYNALGALLATEQLRLKNGKANVKMTDAAAGLYLICIQDEQTTCIKFNIR